MENLQAVSNVKLDEVEPFDYSTYEEQYHIAVLLHLFQKSLNQITVTAKGNAILNIDPSHHIVYEARKSLTPILHKLLKTCFNLHASKTGCGYNEKHCSGCYDEFKDGQGCEKAYCCLKAVGVMVCQESYGGSNISIEMPLSFLKTIPKRFTKSDSIVKDIMLDKSDDLEECNKRIKC